MHPRKFRSLELILAGLISALVLLLAIPVFSGMPEFSPPTTPPSPIDKIITETVDVRFHASRRKFIKAL